MRLHQPVCPSIFKITRIGIWSDCEWAVNYRTVFGMWCDMHLRYVPHKNCCVPFCTFRFVFISNSYGEYVSVCFFFVSRQSCDAMLNDAETKNLLNRHFDLVILDGAFPECAVSLVHVFRVPFMMINTVGLYTGSLSLAGNPAPYSTTPIFFSSFTDEMNIYQRSLNTIYTVFAYSMHRVSDFDMGWSLYVSVCACMRA